jgi:hypothetical protein
LAPDVLDEKGKGDRDRERDKDKEVGGIEIEVANTRARTWTRIRISRGPRPIKLMADGATACIPTTSIPPPPGRPLLPGKKDIQH